MSVVPVSVVIPTSGRFDLLERALNSLVQSTLVPREVIIVADSSLENPNEYLESLKSQFGQSFEKLICIQSFRASGAAGTRNAGMSLVSNEFVAFLDDDDEFLPEKLKIQVSAMQESGAIFSFSDYIRVSDSLSTYADCRPKQRYKGNLAREIAFDDCRIATPTVVLRMSFVEQLMPLFPEEMALREDNYAWLRILLKPGAISVHLPEALSQVNLAESSVQRPAEGPKISSGFVTSEARSIISLAKRSGLRAPFLHLPIRLLVTFSLFTLDKLLKK